MGKQSLGMNIKFKNKRAKIEMKKYSLKVINTFDDDLTRNAATPATSCLFKTREIPELEEKRAEISTVRHNHYLLYQEGAG